MVQPVNTSSNTLADALDPGEYEAILLAQELHANLLILDDMKARKMAMGKVLAIIGTLGILDQATTRKIIDLPKAISKLGNTSFWASDNLFDKLIQRHF